MFFFFQAEDGIRDYKVTGVQTCALPICMALRTARHVMTLQQGSLDLTLRSPAAGELVAAFAPVGAAGMPAGDDGSRPAASVEASAASGKGPSRPRILIVEGIGRASGRERVWISEGSGTFKK